MSKTWQFIKGHGEYVYALVCFGLAAWSFTHDDPDGGWVSVVIGVAIFFLMRWLGAAERVKPDPGPITFEQGEIEALRRAGMEPVPIPGENAHDPNCAYCKALSDDFLKRGSQ